MFWYPKLICTSNSRAFKTKHFDINLMKIGGLIRKLWVIKYEIWTAAILFSSLGKKIRIKSKLKASFNIECVLIRLTILPVARNKHLSTFDTKIFGKN